VIVTNSIDNTVQGIDPTTLKTVGEVSLGAGENPTYAACDGVSTLYVADWQAGDIKSIDLSKPTWTVGQTLAIPTADTAVLADGGFAQPTPNGIAFAATDGGGELLVSLENLNFAKRLRAGRAFDGAGDRSEAPGGAGHHQPGHCL